MKNPQKEFDRQCRQYRNISIPISGLIIIVFSTILTTILVKGDLTAKVIWFSLLFVIFLAFVIALLAVYFILVGRLRRAKQKTGRKADLCVVISLFAFLIGSVLGIIILIMQYFQRGLI